MTFETFRFDQRLAAGIRAAGYETPTPIQTQAMPPVLSGSDVMGLARTGSGKTAAFVLPILQRLIDQDAPRRGPVRALVLAPTRELALQIHETFVDLGAQTGYRSASVFGGVGAGPQIRALRQSTVIVACPGRLLDLMNQGHADLSKVDVLVLDEADRMLDMGFMPDIKKILAKLPEGRQNLLFSATMPPEIDRLCRGILRDPVTVKVADSAPTSSVSHAMYPVRKHLKTRLLESILKTTEHDCMLVFTRTKHRAKNLARQLGNKGWAATSMQGNLSQNKRKQAMDGFRCGDYRIMVATDIAARGIDCSRVTHVVNFDMPDTAETYTHRIGRTGRADRTGEALSLITAEDGLLVRRIEGLMGRKIARMSVDGFDYDSAPVGRPVAGDVDEREGGGPRGQRGYGPRGAGRGGRPGGGGKFGARGKGKAPAKAPAKALAKAQAAPMEDGDPYHDPDAGLSRRARGENPARGGKGRGRGGRGKGAGAEARNNGAGRGAAGGPGNAGGNGRGRGGAGGKGTFPNFGKGGDTDGNRVRTRPDKDGNRIQARPDRDGNRAQARPQAAGYEGGYGKHRGGEGSGARGNGGHPARKGGAGSAGGNHAPKRRADGEFQPRGHKGGGKPFGKSGQGSRDESRGGGGRRNGRGGRAGNR